jgi:hypothetical protein
MRPIILPPARTHDVSYQTVRQGASVASYRTRITATLTPEETSTFAMATVLASRAARLDGEKKRNYNTAEVLRLAIQALAITSPDTEQLKSAGLLYNSPDFWSFIKATIDHGFENPEPILARVAEINEAIREAGYEIRHTIPCELPKSFEGDI